LPTRPLPNLPARLPLNIEMSKDDLQQGGYELLLLLVKGNNDKLVLMLKFVEDQIRPYFEISRKKSEYISSMIQFYEAIVKSNDYQIIAQGHSIVLDPVMFRFTLLRNINKNEMQKDNEELNAFERRNKILLFNLLLDESKEMGLENSVVSLFSDFDLSMINYLEKMELIAAEIMTAKRNKGENIHWTHRFNETMFYLIKTIVRAFQQYFKVNENKNDDYEILLKNNLGVDQDCLNIW
ncbi:hypothetical protein ROZALSC1DRAFT_27671, partial [Rozella allomycis CSF55]